MNPQPQFDPHANQPLLTAGRPLEEAAGVIVMLHGRGGTGQDMLSLYDELGMENLAALTLQAAGNTWYPQSFLAPLPANQPYLDSALRRLDTLVTDILARGIPGQRIAMLGFSQGACLTLEFVARYPRRYGAIMGLTGGLIGPPGTPRTYPGSLDGTPIFLGSGDPDPHVPFARVEESAAVLMRMGATVDLRRYPGRSHTISDDELVHCRQVLGDMLRP